ncbi:flavocytochrome c [Lactobacillus mulieris]|uniref:Flavocytochrome c n=1 Tax=Lactobacillus mulieris TaxID=2508708 RepID=A0AAW5WW03_9LACO|nr:flavocytochrome c [Lactobacillus mulieris]MCZ3621511.1 flavocytochrome c [Lactobacillus mulieris]MCZ3623213.1 flavocytochrome c [Lactobacillus mulieris]MCZ3635518.1 flavocytochrome c [Lactobacillus mulieris]MCZ3689374.1 flavocytochrome c [Lactobacillus mulieris]MCZ3695377.1 flavocytochrome c [Lactobacillus mulieris]
MAKFVFTPKESSEIASSYDAVIVGAGGTGLTAAMQAHELGLKVAVFEKNEGLGGNTNKASSGMNASESNVQYAQGIIDNKEDFYKETLKGGGLLNDRDMLRYFVDHSAIAISWLEEHGIDLTDLTITGGMSKKRAHRPASMAPVGGYLVTGLLKKIQEEDIPVFNKAKVTKLVKEDKAVTGIEVETESGLKKVVAKAVLLASGGFGASKEMMKKYRPDLVDYKTTNQAGATGDGLKLAEAVDAQLMQMEYVQVHPTAQTDGARTFLIGEAVRGEGAILVNRAGKRFVNELNTRKIVSNAITGLNEDGAYLIFDQGIRNHVKAVEFYDAIGLVKHGASLAELANEIGVDAANLEATVKTWNEAVKAANDAEFGRSTGMERGIEKGPFFAIHVHPAIHYTMGGIHITPKTEVLDTNGNVIKGLYAAGEVSGGLHGNNRIGGNSIAETVIFGRQAGMQMAKFAREN